MEEKIKNYSKVISNIRQSGEIEVEKYLTQIVANYGFSTVKEIDDLIEMVIKLTSEKTVTVEQLITAISKASPTLSSTDINIKKLALWSGLITEITEESGQFTGNFLKSFVSRINGIEEVRKVLKEEAEIEDFSKLSKVVDGLTSKWDSFSDKKKEEIAIKVAGRYHKARFIVLIEQLSKQ